MSGPAPAPSLLGLERAAAAAWASLGLSRRSAGDIETLSVKTKGPKNSAVYRLHGAGPSGESVVAKKQAHAQAEFEGMIYESVLAKLPVSSLRFYGLARDSDPDFSWLFLEDAGDAFEPSSPLHLEATGRWLAELHAAAADAIGDHALPHCCGMGKFEDRLARSQALLRGMRSSGQLGAEQRNLVRALGLEIDRLAQSRRAIAACCGEHRDTLIHCDLTRKNVRIKERDGSPAVLVLDWESAGRGVAATDLSQFLSLSQGADLSSYGARMAELTGAGDIRRLGRLAAAGAIFRLQSSLNRKLGRIGDALKAERNDSRHRVLSRELADLQDYPSWLAAKIGALDAQ